MKSHELKNLRESRNLSQRELATILDVNNASVARWEAGQEIPSPMQKLLELFFHNTNPFPQHHRDPNPTGKSPLWEMTFTVEEYEQMQTLAVRKGFENVKAYIIHIVKKHLSEQRQSSRIHPIDHTPHPSDLRLNEDPPLTKLAR